VFLACGRAPWGTRRPVGRDIVTWLNATTWFRTPVSALPAPAARLFANIQSTGKEGGHDLHYRTLQAGWVRFPAFDSVGFPITRDGTSMVVP
jgi:hypothetical protein